jgi:hypothetical protein
VVAEVEGPQITLGDAQDFILAPPPHVAQEDFQILYPRMVEQLFYRTALAIRVHQTYRQSTREAMQPYIEQKPDLVVHGCTAAGFLGGPDGNPPMIEA